jgi:phosphate transport system substrate-binding protein
MADVYLAARHGPVQFTKLVVIKRLRGDVAEQDAQRLRTLLLDEARLAARMHHPNIVQTFEVSDNDGEPYMTMEFLDGQSLHQVMRAVHRAGERLPLELVLRVVGDVLAALAYAHDLTDFDGRPLQIVHRDVGPQNIFWTYDGDIKLMDFGVAKFAQGSIQTDAGFIKGKVTYMAPEQGRGESLDGRADVFAVGIVMWELLTGRRLFKAESQAASLKKLLFESIPDVAGLVPDLDPHVAAVCMRALAHDRDERYATAGVMRADIERALGAASPRRDDLGSFVQTRFARQRAAVTELIRNALSNADGAVLPLVPSASDDSAELVSDHVSEAAATVPSGPDQTMPPKLSANPRVITGLLIAISVVFGAVVGVALRGRHHAAQPARRPAPTVVGTAPPFAATKSTTPPPPAPTKPPQPSLRLCGSYTIGAELAPALVEEFLRARGASQVVRRAGSDADAKQIDAMLADQPLTVDVQARATTTAFEGLASGACDIGMASREIKADEALALKRAGFGDMQSPGTEYVIGLDGIAVIAHPNTRVQTLDRSALRAVFSGKLTDWSELGGPSGAIQIYAHDDTSSAYDTFKHLVLDTDSLASNAKRFASSEALADAVATDPAGIGFTQVAYVRTAKAIAVGDVGARAMLPTAFTVSTEDYMLSRRLYFYTSPTPRTPLVAELVSFVLSPRGQDVVRNTGFVELTPALRVGDPCEAHCPHAYAAATAHAKRVSIDFRFRPGSNELDSRAARDLDRLVEMLRSYPDGKLMLFGFSDVSGDPAANTKLARQRTESVVRELGTRGVVPAVVLTLGSALPVASNSDEVGRQRNRRVEVWLQAH